MIQKKIKSLQEQQFEVANVLLSLPAKGYKSQLDKIVKDSQTGIVTGGNVESLVEFLLTNDQSIYPHFHHHFPIIPNSVSFSILFSF